MYNVKGVQTFDTVEGFESNIALNVLIALKCRWLSPPKK
jgi:hypothetical protein